MKFKKKEAKATKESCRIDLKRLRLEDAPIKPYFKKTLGLYFSKTVNPDDFERVQREKAKYLLDGNTEEAKHFQREILCGMINRALSLPDEKLALTGRDAEKFLETSLRDVTLLLSMEDLFGPDFNDRALLDFAIPQECIDALKHKRALIDSAKNELPDIKYDGYVVNKNSVIEYGNLEEDTTPENQKTLRQQYLDQRYTEAQIPLRSGFDDLMELAPGSRALKEAFNRIPGIDAEDKARITGFLDQLDEVRSATDIYFSHYGQGNTIFTGDFKVDRIANAIAALRDFPDEILESLPQDAAGVCQQVRSTITRLKNTEMVKMTDVAPLEIATEAAQRQTVRTLFANVDLIRAKLSAMGYDEQITDWKLVSTVSRYIHTHRNAQGPDAVNHENCLDKALDYLRKSEQRVEKEREWQKNTTRKDITKATTATGWAQVARDIAKIELLKTMPKDELIDFDELETRATEYLLQHPNLSLNVSMHSPQLLEEYFAGTRDLVNEFRFVDAPMENINLQEVYAELQNLMPEAEEALPDDKPIVPFENNRAFYQRVENEQRMSGYNGFSSEILKELNLNIPTPWLRMVDFLTEVPLGENPADTVRRNYEFAINFANNPVQENGKTFRQNCLLQQIERFKTLDAAQLCSLSDEELKERWPRFQKDWNIAFVGARDLMNICEAEHLVLSEEEKNTVNYLNQQATLLFMPVQMHYMGLCNPYVPLLDGLSIEDREYVPDTFHGKELQTVWYKNNMGLSEYAENRKPYWP